MKKVLILGFGCMGRVHYDVWKKMKGVKVVGIVARNPNALKIPPAKAYGYVEVADGQPLPADLRLFGDLAAALETTRPDIVDVTLPTRLHVDAAVASMKAGADVLCEKPMALDRRGCDAMMAAARRTGRKLMVAQCLRFAPEYRYLRDLVVSKKYGDVVTAEFTRLTAPPRTPAGAKAWFFDERLSGGLALDLNVHDADVVRWLFGEPKKVSVEAHRRGAGVDHISVRYDYPGKFVTTVASWAASPSFAFQFGYRVFFENASVVYDPWRKVPLEVYPAKGEPFPARIRPASPYAEEIKAFHAWTLGRVKSAPVDNADIRKTVVLITEKFGL